MAKADTSVKYFHSAMPGAPVLSGTAGSLIAVLDACLVNGFGLKTVDSLVVAGNVATANISTGHSAEKDTVVLIAGATPAELNGEWKVSAVTTNTVKFVTEGIADQTATGTIALKMAPAGWDKSFSGTNLAAYRSKDILATGGLLRVDDTAAQVSRVVGYESMSGVSAGLGPFPTSAQITGGGYWLKSDAASAASVGWVLASDGRFTILNVSPALWRGAGYYMAATRFFGDIIPLKPSGDPYCFTLNYSISTTASQYDATLDGYSGNALQTATPRGITGLGSASPHCHLPYTGLVSGQAVATSGLDATFGDFPSIVDGKLRLSRRYLASAGSGAPPRGDIPGWFHVPQAKLSDQFKPLDTVIHGAKTLLAVCGGTTTFAYVPTTNNAGIGFIDITGPWR